MDSVGDLASALDPDVQQPDSAIPICETENDLTPIEKASKPNKKPIEFDFHFPEEVWEIILDNVTEGGDLTNCCKAFPLFDRILTRRKPVWMFRQILPLLCAAWADLRTVLTCRRVCENWRADIDHAILTNPNFWYETCGCDTEVKTDEWYLFDSKEKLESFAENFDGHSGNPFITRSVGIQNYLDDREKNYVSLPMFLELLSNYGEHIWTLEFNFGNPVGYDVQDPIHRLDWFDSYEFFQHALTSTPHLRKLIIRANGDTKRLDLDGPRNEYNFCRTLAQHPLPHIGPLDTLEIDTLFNVNFFPNSFTRTLILSYATNLQELGMDVRIFGHMLPQLASALPKLTRLQVEQVVHDEDLERLLLLTAPLKLLEIRGYFLCSAGSSSNSINLSTLLDVVHNFQLLDQVRIRRCFFAAEGDVSHRVNSSVRKLSLDKIGGSGVPTFFNFLQVFKALEELDVNLESPKKTYVGRNEGEGELQFYRMLENGQLYESNIWSLIPSLQKVDIFTYDDDYDEICVRGNRKEFGKYQANKLQN